MALKEPKTTLQREVLLLALMLPSQQVQGLPTWQGHGRDTWDRGQRSQGRWGQRSSPGTPAAQGVEVLEHR